MDSQIETLGVLFRDSFSECSTVGGTLLGSQGENVAKLGTILPISYQSL